MSLMTVISISIHLRYALDRAMLSKKPNSYLNGMRLMLHSQVDAKIHYKMDSYYQDSIEVSSIKSMIRECQND